MPFATNNTLLFIFPCHPRSNISPFWPPVSFGSCMVGPDFRTPTNDLPATWEANRPPHSSDKDLRSWWNIFGDPQLNRLVSTSLNNNPDMKVALLRIREAREKLRVSQASLLPSADASARVEPVPGQRFSQLHFPELLPGQRPPPGSWTSLAATGVPSRPPAPPSCPRKLPQGPCAQPCWRTSPRPTLTGLPPANSSASPGNNWKSNAAPSPLRKNATKTEFAPRLDVEQATSTVASTESRIPQLEAQVASSKNQLAVLLGTYNSRVELTLPKASVFEKTPTVPVGLPSELLRRRPDVIAAEADLHAAVANVGVAVADLYPRFSLTGSLSSRGGDFGQLFRENNNAWSLGRESAPAPVPRRSPREPRFAPRKPQQNKLRKLTAKRSLPPSPRWRTP